MSISSMQPLRSRVSFQATLSFTGSQTISLTDIPGSPKKIVAVTPTLKESVSTEVDKAVNLSAVIAANGQSVVIYAWKVTGAADTTRLAATAAVDVTALIDCDMEG